MSAVEHVFVVQQLVLLMPKELAAHETGLVHVEAVEAGDQGSFFAIPPESLPARAKDSCTLVSFPFLFQLGGESEYTLDGGVVRVGGAAAASTVAHNFPVAGVAEEVV